MPNKKITDYSTLSTPNGDELLILSSSGTTMNIALDTIKSFAINGISTTYVTGGTYSNGTATFTNNTGGTFTVTGFKTDDLILTGGTYSDGTATFTNNTGGTFTVTGFSNISDSSYSVYNGLSANGTSTATTSICNYGVNIFTGVTDTNYATKLPQPVTGKSVKIANMSNTILNVYPSNIGGWVNNLPVNSPAQIPPDGKLYEFICILNPLPGAWTWSAPATAQYDSGEITCTTTEGSGSRVMAANSSNFSTTTTRDATTDWCYDGKNHALVINDGASIAFKEATPWKGMTKLKFYTNLTDGVGINDNNQIQFDINAGFGYSYHDITSGDFIDTGTGYAGTFGVNVGRCNKVIAGKAANPTGITQTNIGDAGTIWGELDISNKSVGLEYNTIVGDIDMGIVTFPYGGEYQGQLVNKWYSGYINVKFLPRQSATDIKFRFIIEHF